MGYFTICVILPYADACKLHTEERMSFRVTRALAAYSLATILPQQFLMNQEISRVIYLQNLTREIAMNPDAASFCNVNGYGNNYYSGAFLFYAFEGFDAFLS